MNISKFIKMGIITLFTSMVVLTPYSASASLQTPSQFGVIDTSSQRSEILSWTGSGPTRGQAKAVAKSKMYDWKKRKNARCEFRRSEEIPQERAPDGSVLRWSAIMTYRCTW